MLLVLDVGNSNIVVGLYDGDELQHHWRLTTNPKATVGEYGDTLRNLLVDSNTNPSTVSAIAIGSVVPEVTERFATACRHLGCEVWTAGVEQEFGVRIRYDQPLQLGIDRLLNMIAVHSRRKGSAIVVDCGTATKVDCINAEGEYLGGMIAPGLMISLNALYNSAPRLPKIELKPPKQAVGRNTIECMQSGTIYGYAGLVEALVKRAKTTLVGEPHVVATGGLAGLVAEEVKCFHEVAPFLTLDGLRLAYDLVHPQVPSEERSEIGRL